jgi:hypothetical protein
MIWLEREQVYILPRKKTRAARNNYDRGRFNICPCLKCVKNGERD